MSMNLRKSLMRKSFNLHNYFNLRNVDEESHRRTRDVIL